QEIDDILARYQNDPRRRGSSEEKREAIAEATTALYRGRYFREGDAQSTVFLAMNRMLMQAGLSPAFVRQPERFDKMTPEQAGAEILKGQLAFQLHVKPGAMDTPTFLHQQIDRVMREGGVSFQEAVAELTRAIADNEQLPQGTAGEFLPALEAIR